MPWDCAALLADALAADELADSLVALDEALLADALPDEEPPQAASPNARATALHASMIARILFMVSTFPRDICRLLALFYLPDDLRVAVSEPG